MRVDLYGGFGEKGRTSVGIRGGGKRIVLDVGIKVGATGAEYYPAMDDEDISRLDAVFISHAHEDHIGGLGWLLYKGFRGRIFMTAETLAEAPDMLKQYGESSHLDAFPLADQAIHIFAPGDRIDLDGMVIETGRSGHVVGGVWFLVRVDEKRIVYTADIVPDSNVFVMDPIPACDFLIFDASYGDDPVSGRERSVAIQGWIADQEGAALLPVPISGKPLELMAILPDHFAVHADMRSAVLKQISASQALLPGMMDGLMIKMQRAQDWTDQQDFPPCPLLTFDGMGAAGPSVEAIRRAEELGVPVLLTGHIPENTPASAMYAQGKAKWIRLPTHPTRSENVDIWNGAERPAALGHSCPLPSLEKLKPHIPGLNDTALTGNYFTI